MPAQAQKRDRRKKPPEEVRGELMQVTVTTDEREKLFDEAEYRGLSFSSWAREVLLEALE